MEEDSGPRGIGDHLSSFTARMNARKKEKQPRTKWDELRDQLLEIVNRQNVMDGYRKMSVAEMQKRLKSGKYIDGEKRDEWGLSILLGKCKDSNQPSRTFNIDINTRSGKYVKKAGTLKKPGV